MNAGLALAQEGSLPGTGRRGTLLRFPASLPVEREPETVSSTANRICEQALNLDGIDTAGVYAFEPSGAVVPLALSGARWPEEVVGEPLPIGRARHMLTCAARPWIESETVVGGPGPIAGQAFAPMRWDDVTVGVVSIGSTRRAEAGKLSDRLSALSELGVVTAAMLGPMLVDDWRLAALRAQLQTIIANHAFEVVFQPIVEIQTREIVGFEALTRFRDGVRPDKRFVDADSAGMSISLETACLAEQLESASWLPQGTWVSLNVSPTLVTAVVPLVSALERADREVVLEITEHVEIEDYRQLVAALELVRSHCRLAVDDAGAGYAGLRHILELRPQYVKLDLSLVRNIDTDPARQAMVAGMAHFARNSDCELIAEGIETEGESAMLVRLGVSLGQGYLYGRPAPVA